MKLLECLLKAHEELEKKQQRLAAFAISVRVIEHNITDLDAEIVQLKRYLDGKETTYEDLTLASLCTRKAHLERSLATLRSRSAEIEEELRVAGEKAQSMETLVRKALEENSEKSGQAVEK